MIDDPAILEFVCLYCGSSNKSFAVFQLFWCFCAHLLPVLSSSQWLTAFPVLKEMPQCFYVCLCSLPLKPNWSQPGPPYWAPVLPQVSLFFHLEGVFALYVTHWLEGLHGTPFNVIWSWYWKSIYSLLLLKGSGVNWILPTGNILAHSRVFCLWWRTLRPTHLLTWTIK